MEAIYGHIWLPYMAIYGGLRISWPPYKQHPATAPPAALPAAPPAAPLGSERDTAQRMKY